MLESNPSADTGDDAIGQGWVHWPCPLRSQLQRPTKR
jgi:hypothetical protein